MREKRQISVDQIAQSASIWAFAATAVFVVVSVLVALVYGFKRGVEKEDARLSSIAPVIARSVASELLVGDEKSYEMLNEELLRRFNLSDLAIGSDPFICRSEGAWWSVFGRNIFESCMSVPMREIGESRYLVVKSRDRKLVSAKWMLGIFWFCIPICLFGAFVTYRIRRALRQSIADPIKKLAGNLEGWQTDDPNVAQEIHVLHDKLRTYMMERDSERDKAQALFVQASIGEMASQVAHDIRSPLAALEMLASSLGEIPEEKRVLMRSAISRIKDIANWLMNRQRAALKKTGPVEVVKAAKTELLSGLVDTLISEKRMQYRGRLGLEIEVVLSPRAYGLFASLQGTEFKRVLSNLIDNAADSLEDFGRIVVEMYADSTSVFVLVRDNGKGIPADVLPKLMNKGQSFGKKKGVGLGLFHARSVVEGWGGRIVLDSKEGKGTTIEIQLPRTPVPEWFASELRFDNDGAIVVLDDDTSIHQIWEGRFRSLKTKELGIELVHLSSAQSLLEWHAGRSSQYSSVHYLIDYELVGEDRTGLDLIAQLAIGAQSVLVTSRSEEIGIRSACRRLKVPILPKGLAGFVPIRIVQKSTRSLANSPNTNSPSPTLQA